MVADLRLSRELAWSLLLRSLRSQYRRPLLGYLWIFLPPAATTLIWVILHQRRIFQISNLSVPYPVYILAGTLLWQTFVDALNSPYNQLTSSEFMLTKINFSREALLLAGVGEVVFNGAVRLVLLIIVMLGFQLTMTPGVLLGALGLLALVLLGGAIGLVLAPIGMLYPDVHRGLSILTLAWFFLTPIVYVLPAGQGAPLAMGLNPAGPLLIATRDLLISGHTSQWQTAVLGIGAVPVILIAGWAFFRLAMPHVILRLSAR
jgi:lipopolysaccharide transport system permease protein